MRGSNSRAARSPIVAIAIACAASTPPPFGSKRSRSGAFEASTRSVLVGGARERVLLRELDELERVGDEALDAALGEVARRRRRDLLALHHAKAGGAMRRLLDELGLARGARAPRAPRRSAACTRRRSRRPSSPWRRCDRRARAARKAPCRHVTSWRRAYHTNASRRGRRAGCTEHERRRRSCAACECGEGAAQAQTSKNHPSAIESSRLGGGVEGAGAGRVGRCRWPPRGRLREPLLFVRLEAGTIGLGCVRHEGLHVHG